MSARLIDRVLACAVARALAVPLVAPAQTAASPPPFKAEEIDKLVAPIALYPRSAGGADPDGLDSYRSRSSRPRAS